MGNWLRFLGLGPLELLIFAVIAVVLFAWRLPAVMRSLERGLRDAQQPPIIAPRRPLYEEGGGKWGAITLCVILILAIALTACIKLGLWP
jgi:hypothetical protein